jgi:multicomponent Na+:H+ antiporter subunit D
MEVFDLRPVLAPAISFTCAGLVFAMGRSAFWRAFWSLGAAVFKLAVVASMLPGVLRGSIYISGGPEFPPGIALAFRVDGLGMFFALVSSTLWVLTTIYALGYMKDEGSQARFFGFFALCVSTTVAIAFAENLLTLFIFYELLTVCTYPLLVHRQSPEALRAGRKYLTYLLVGGAFVLLGTALTWASAGTLTLSGNGILSLEAGRPALALIFVTLIVGFGVKTAIMPLHGWLPSAMVAPTPVSALLHAVAVVKVGAFGVLRLIYNVFGVELLGELGFTVWLAGFAAVTIGAASIMALLQQNLKRRLAYSTISQLSYIVLAGALLTPLAAMAAVAHLANQAFPKITMFFVAGAIEKTTGKTRIPELVGMGRRMPWTMAAFTVAALSFIGMPLFAGFVTKWYLSLGALEAQAWGFALLMAVSALLNAAYWLPILHIAWFRRPEGDGGSEAWGSREASAWLLVPTLICAAYVVLLGTTYRVPGAPFTLARLAAEAVFGR